MSDFKPFAIAGRGGDTPMDFGFTDDQRALRDVLRQFVDREIVPVAREWEQSGRYPT